MSGYSIKDILEISNISFDSDIYIIHGELQNEKILFMYKPFVDTLLTIFKNYNCYFLYNKVDISKFKKNDIILFIGNLNVPNFKILKSMGLYTIWFWVEPYLIEKINTIYCDIIIFYSKYSFFESSKRLNTKELWFIPVLKEDTEIYVNYLNKKNDIKLCFLGNLIHRTKQKQNQFISKKYLINKNNLFNENDYNLFMINNTCIFLNIIKMESKSLPFPRICKLLSHKCIIISENCNELDDELFKDIVYFCKYENIEKTFYELASNTPEELDNIAQQNYIIFSNRFNLNNNNFFLINKPNL